MSEKDLRDKFEDAYEHMLEVAKEFVVNAREHSGPVIKQALKEAREKVSDITELTTEEIDKLSSYIEKDLTEAAGFMQEQEKELADWLRLDILLIEKYLLEKFASLADRTRIELEQWSINADVNGEWHTGEMISMGVLRCEACGEEVHFKKPGHIPPCPKCNATVYKRLHNT
ncbi:MAG: zinc ribbon-containing protein [Gammaproteobacteria bacterium]|nr:zinc ribbon-containing protein [Gammaproteobacteria bacterium]